jgi:hypothetical protein
MHIYAHQREVEYNHLLSTKQAVFLPAYWLFTIALVWISTYNPAPLHFL